MLARLHGWAGRMACLAGLCPALLASTALAADRASLDAVSVHLFLETSGTLSADVAAIEGFGSWNFVPQNDGFSEDDRFNNIVISVRFTAPKAVFAEGTQAEVVVTNIATKRVVTRKKIADVYIGPKGQTFVPVHVANAACGPFKVTVTGGGKRIEKLLEFRCGE